MFAFAAIPLTCWLCVWFVKPGRSIAGSEIQELVYARLLGRQHLLRYLAIVATAGALFAAVFAMPSHAMPAPGVDQTALRYCTPTEADIPHCYTLQPNGNWVEES
jgi:hypothetical protein